MTQLTDTFQKEESLLNLGEILLFSFSQNFAGGIRNDYKTIPDE